MPTTTRQHYVAYAIRNGRCPACETELDANLRCKCGFRLSLEDLADANGEIEAALKSVERADWETA